MSVNFQKELRLYVWLRERKLNWNHGTKELRKHESMELRSNGIMEMLNNRNQGTLIRLDRGLY